MNAEQLRQIQRQVIGYVRGARSGVEALRNKKDSILGNTERLTEQARLKDIEMVLAEGKASLHGALDDARGIVSRGFDQIGQALEKLKDVAPEDLQLRATLLAPVLNQAVDRPELLINLYRERHLEPADRSLIEGTASATIDALGPDGGEFPQAWHSLLQETAIARSPEEAEALSHHESLETPSKPRQQLCNA